MNLITQRTFKASLMIVFLTVSFQAANANNVCQANAEPINLEEGDVVSAELLSEIVQRINDSQIGMETSDLLGTWSCTANLQPSTSCSSTYVSPATTGLITGGPFNGFSESNGRWSSTQDVVVTSRSDYEVLMTFQYPMSSCIAPQGAQQQCISQIIDGQTIFRTAVNSADCGYGGTGTTCCRDEGGWRIDRRGQYCFTTESHNGSSISCVKKVRPPLAATKLGHTIDSTGITLTWTAADSATNYEIHRKTSATGTFSSVGTSDTTSYSDSSVSSGLTYWYRVFSKNSNGTGTGSNVIKITYDPSATLSSSNIGITDYLNGVASAESEHKIIYSTSSNTMTANLGVGKLDAENLNGLLAGSGGKSPVLKFTLANVPSAGMSGTATLSSKVLEGSDATVDSGERAITATVNVSWSSDGDKL